MMDLAQWEQDQSEEEWVLAVMALPGEEEGGDLPALGAALE